MAYSTQINFFHIPFMNEDEEQCACEKCVKLKKYESSFDDRSWASDSNKKSRFIVDLVSCNFPIFQRRESTASDTKKK